MPVGRPSFDFDQDIADRICAEIAYSDKSVSAICEEFKDDGFPSERTVYRWLSDQEGFRQQYARARESQGEYMALLVYQIAKTPIIGQKTKTTSIAGQPATETTIGDNVERSRLMVDAAKWTASKLAPKKYGDRIEHEHTGGITLVNDSIPRPRRSE